MQPKNGRSRPLLAQGAFSHLEEINALEYNSHSRSRLPSQGSRSQNGLVVKQRRNSKDEQVYSHREHQASSQKGSRYQSVMEDDYSDNGEAEEDSQVRYKEDRMGYRLPRNGEVSKNRIKKGRSKERHMSQLNDRRVERRKYPNKQKRNLNSQYDGHNTGLRFSRKNFDQMISDLEKSQKQVSMLKKTINHEKVVNKRLRDGLKENKEVLKQEEHLHKKKLQQIEQKVVTLKNTNLSLVEKSKRFKKMQEDLDGERHLINIYHKKQRMTFEFLMEIMVEIFKCFDHHKKKMLKRTQTLKNVQKKILQYINVEWDSLIQHKLGKKFKLLTDNIIQQNMDNDEREDSQSMSSSGDEVDQKVDQMIHKANSQSSYWGNSSQKKRRVGKRGQKQHLFSQSPSNSRYNESNLYLQMQQSGSHSKNVDRSSPQEKYYASKDTAFPPEEGQQRSGGKPIPRNRSPVQHQVSSNDVIQHQHNQRSVKHHSGQKGGVNLVNYFDSSTPKKQKILKNPSSSHMSQLSDRKNATHSHPSSHSQYQSVNTLNSQSNFKGGFDQQQKYQQQQQQYQQQSISEISGGLKIPTASQYNYQSYRDPENLKNLQNLEQSNNSNIYSSNQQTKITNFSSNQTSSNYKPPISPHKSTNFEQHSLPLPHNQENIEKYEEGESVHDDGPTFGLLKEKHSSPSPQPSPPKTPKDKQALRGEAARDKDCPDLLSALKIGLRDPYETKPDQIAVAKHSLAAELPTDLALEKGDGVRIVDKKSNGWWLVENLETGCYGYAPSTYLALIQLMQFLDVSCSFASIQKILLFQQSNNLIVQQHNYGKIS